jgi:hypothetical protein
MKLREARAHLEQCPICAGLPGGERAALNDHDMYAALCRATVEASERAFEAFTGHPRGTKSCVTHEPTHDPECSACLEADIYCPHGSLGLKHHWGAQEGDGCWRPWTKWDGDEPGDWWVNR